MSGALRSIGAPFAVEDVGLGWEFFGIGNPITAVVKADVMAHTHVAQTAVAKTHSPVR